MGRLRDQAECHYCGGPVDIRKPGTFQRVSGWVENRTAGGANTIALSEREYSWACGDCINRLRSKISPQQGVFMYP